MEYAEELLAKIGLEPERVRMFNVSSAMAGQFVSLGERDDRTHIQARPQPSQKNPNSQEEKEAAKTICYPNRSKIFRDMITLKDGVSVLLRPMNRDDREGLIGLFSPVSDEDLRYLRDNVRDPAVDRRLVHKPGLHAE